MELLTRVQIPYKSIVSDFAVIPFARIHQLSNYKCILGSLALVKQPVSKENSLFKPTLIRLKIIP